MLQIISGWDQGDFNTPKRKKDFRTCHFIYACRDINVQDNERELYVYPQ